MSWEKATLGDIADIFSGYAFKSADMNSERGTPLIKIKNIADSRVSHQCDAFLNKDFDLSKYERFHLLCDDFLVAMTGQGSVGRIGKMRSYRPGYYVNQRVAIARVNPQKANPVFVYYQIATKSNELELFKKANGAGQPNISAKQIGELSVLLPPIAAQQYIADILSAYDILIENNQKQIKLLEEAAQRLYKEWFVDLRFPGYENTPIVDGVPEGWKKERLVDVVKVQYGYAFDGSLFNANGNGTPIVRIRNIPSGTTGDYTTETAESQYIVHNGDLLVGMDGEFHINSWSGSDAYLVQRTCSFRPHNDKMKGYLLQAIYEPIKYFESTVVGATVAHLGKKHIDTITVLTCPDTLYVPFQQHFERRQLLLNQNQLLAEARDRLLPKLINGEIEV